MSAIRYDDGDEDGDDVTALVLFLSGAAAAMITGTTQTIDGGLGI